MAQTTPFRRWRTSLILFLAVLGPGFITANVDNDAGGILTYSQAGAHYGYTLLWTMIPITIALIVVQEMCARMGAVTGKGLSDLIREEFGLRMTFFMMILLVIVNFGNVIAEFSGIAGSMQLFHIPKYASVPVCAVLVWALVVKGNYKSVEKIFLIASVFYIAYIITGVLSGPNWHLALVETIKLPPRQVWRDRDYVYMTVGVIGTTITPWMQFYLQSSIVEKGVTVRQLKASRLDVIVGSIFTDIVAWFIVVACAATLFTHGIRDINIPADAANAMKPLAGQYAFILFAAGLFNASLFAASILPAIHCLHRLRGHGLRARCRQNLQGSPLLLLALHPPHRLWSRRRPHPQLPPRPHHHPLASPQRHPPPHRPHLHAQADQQARADGQAHQLPLLQRHRLGHLPHRHRPHRRPPLGHLPRHRRRLTHPPKAASRPRASHSRSEGRTRKVCR